MKLTREQFEQIAAGQFEIVDERGEPDNIWQQPPPSLPTWSVVAYVSQAQVLALEALESAHGAILDAVSCEDGLDGNAGDAVLGMIRAALIANGRTPPDMPPADAVVPALPIWTANLSYPDHQRLIDQALAIEQLLRDAGVGACPLTEGVRQLIDRAGAVPQPEPAWTGFSPERLRFSVKVDRHDFWVRDRQSGELRLLTEAEWKAVMRPAGAVTQQEPQDWQPMTAGWCVRVSVFDELVVSISERELAGRDLSEADENLIRECAQHLLSFVGKRRGAVPKREPASQIVLCSCAVVTGGHRALNQACPLHGKQPQVLVVRTMAERERAIGKSYRDTRPDVADEAEGRALALFAAAAALENAGARISNENADRPSAGSTT
jgi:hypothetical protein